MSSKLRSVSTKFWSDPLVEDLEPEQKLLWLYLMTNDKTNMLGIYELSLKKMSFETGLTKKQIEVAFKVFAEHNKIDYKENHVIIYNFMKHQKFNPNMKRSAVALFKELPAGVIGVELSIDNQDYKQAFETLYQAFTSVRKIETKVEVETQVEVETKTKKLFVQVSDETELEKQEEKIAFAFWGLFKSNLESLGRNKSKNLDNAKVDDWANTIRLMIEKDGVNVEQFQRLFKFLKVDKFEQANVQSVGKLRERFDNLYVKATVAVSREIQAERDKDDFETAIMEKLNS